MRKIRQECLDRSPLNPSWLDPVRHARSADSNHCCIASQKHRSSKDAVMLDWSGCPGLVLSRRPVDQGWPRQHGLPQRWCQLRLPKRLERPDGLQPSGFLPARVSSTSNSRGPRASGRPQVPEELGYPNGSYSDVGPRPSNFSGERALSFVLQNRGFVDKTCATPCKHVPARLELPGPEPHRGP